MFAVAKANKGALKRKPSHRIAINPWKYWKTGLKEKIQEEDDEKRGFVRPASSSSECLPDTRERCARKPETARRARNLGVHSIKRELTLRSARVTPGHQEPHMPMRLRGVRHATLRVDL